MMAPEIFENTSELDVLTRTHKYDGKKADIYSAGLIVYCLLTGKRLDSLKDIKKNPNNVLDQDCIKNLISENMKQFFKNCLDLNPNSRCTVDEALDLLKKCQGEQQIL